VSSDSSNEWDFTAHSIVSNSGTGGRPVLRRGTSMPLSSSLSLSLRAGLPENSSFEDLEKAGENGSGEHAGTTMPRTMLRRSHSVNTETNGQYGDTITASRAPHIRGISRHRSLGLSGAPPNSSMKMYHHEGSLTKISSDGQGSLSMQRKKHMRGIHRSQSTGHDGYEYDNTAHRQRSDLQPTASGRSGKFAMMMHRHSMDHANEEQTRLIIAALSQDSDSDDNAVSSSSGRSCGGESSDVCVSPKGSDSPASKPPLHRKSAQSIPFEAARNNGRHSGKSEGGRGLQSAFSFHKQIKGASAAVSSDDFDDSVPIVSGDACLADSFYDEESKASNSSAPTFSPPSTASSGSAGSTPVSSVATPTVPPGSAPFPAIPALPTTAGAGANNNGSHGNIASARQGNEVSPRAEIMKQSPRGIDNVAPFKTVLKVLADAHLSSSLADLAAENESDDSRIYSGIFVNVVKPTMQHVRDLTMAELDSQLIEIQQKRLLKQKLEQLQSANTKQNQKVMATLGTLESLDNQEKELRSQQEITRDILTVLIAAMTALDIASKGDLTNEFATTLSTFVDEDLEGCEEEEN
jgi:hypothetical protein